MTPHYQDGQLLITDAGITISDYYFPSSSRRFIPWNHLKSVRRFELTIWNGKYRIWGMGLRPHWFNCDGNRPKKSIGFILNTGSFMKAAITPDDPEKVSEIFSQRGLLQPN